jgi:hypothetical protein
LPPLSTNSDAAESIASTIQLQSSVPHGNTLRALVTVIWRWHLDEVFVKVNGWLEQANLRMLVEIRVRLDRAGGSKRDRAVLDVVKSRVLDTGTFRSARWHCTAESEIGTVRAKDLSSNSDDPAGRFRSSAVPGIALPHL